jgi:hypothetical protein
MKINKIILNFLLSFFWILFLSTISWALEVTGMNGIGSKDRRVISPYVQVVPNDSYTFIGVSHPSLTTALTQIGVILEVRSMETVPNNAAGRAAVFTIGAGETHRIFVVNVGHSTINTSNAAFTDSNTHLIFTKNSAQFGNVSALSVNQYPLNATTIRGVKKYANLSQLSMWGVVFIPSSTTGFAMEFIGDAHDSTVTRPSSNNGLNPKQGHHPGAGRGIN